MDGRCAASDDGLTVSARVVELTRHFVVLADSLVEEFDDADLLGELVDACAWALGVEAGGLLAREADDVLEPAAASSGQVAALEKVQAQSERGPGFDCLRAGTQVVAVLADAADRWPEFVAAALAAGFCGVHSIPLRRRSETVGVMDLFVSTSDGLDDDEVQVGRALAEVATIGILQHRAREQATLRARQLQTALTSRVLIEQAKGMLAERSGLSPAESFDRLRAYARATRSPVQSVAEAVVGRQIPADRVIRGMEVPPPRPPG
jgi:transcriptional regulator with GAF, ATPase, and Fis domain